MRFSSLGSLLFVFILNGILHLSAYSQISIPGQVFNQIDKVQDTTTLSFYASISRDSKRNFELINPYIKTSANTAYPRGYNDGPVWKGKGATLEMYGGIQGKLGAFSYCFYPVLYVSQNLSFELAEQKQPNIYTYQYGRIDWVSRYGNNPFASFSPGQSELKYQSSHFIAAISTQNYSIGPAVYNQIILGRQGAGFPHLRFGTTPISLNIKEFNIGQIEANLLMGQLSESNFFDSNPKNNKSFFNGLFLGFSPGFLPELKLGFNKVLYKNTQYFENKDLISVIKVLDGGVRGDSIKTNDTFDQLASFTIDWNFPELGFRAYAEYAKNDFTSAEGLRYFLIEPEHSRGYTIGFERRKELKKNGIIKINYEHTNISLNHTYLWRPEPTFYIHDVNKQGYTNKGQLLGAGIGPGGNSDSFGLMLELNNSKYGLISQRIEHNKDYYIKNVRSANLHNQEYSFGFQYQRESEKLILTFETIYSYDYNKYYISDQSNWYFSSSVYFKIAKHNID